MITRVGVVSDIRLLRLLSSPEKKNPLADTSGLKEAESN
jgi:hypothetical protein